MRVQLGHLTLKPTLENWKWLSEESPDSSRLLAHKKRHRNDGKPRLTDPTTAERLRQAHDDVPNVHQLVDIPAEPCITPLTGRARGYKSRFRQIQTSYTGYQYSFFPRTIVLWNQLPQSAINQSMLLEAFQRQLPASTN